MRIINIDIIALEIMVAADERARELGGPVRYEALSHAIEGLRRSSPRPRKRARYSSRRRKWRAST